MITGLFDRFLGFGLFDLGLNFGEFKAVLGVGLEERNEVLERTVALIVDELFGASRLELESGESADTEGDGGGKVVLRNLEFGTN